MTAMTITRPSPDKRPWWRALTLAGLSLGVAAPAVAQRDSVPAELRPFAARLTPIIAAGSDTAQHYALLLPAHYPASRPSPLLLLLDPRGRAFVPLGRFAEAASRLGFIAMSSYNTQSDGPAEPNVAAVNAMLGDATRVLNIDRSRIYLAGFSGTARIGYAFATELPGVIRGVIAAGAGPFTARGPTAKALARDSAFLVFSTTGTIDFNHDEVLRWDQVLDSAGVGHRTIVFDGGHEWMPRSLATEALEWVAFRHDSAALGGTAAYLARRLNGVDSLRQGPDTVETARWLGQLIRDFGNDTGVMTLLARPEIGAIFKRSRTLVAQESRRMADDHEWIVRADRLLEGLRTADAKLTAARLAQSLDLQRLDRTAKEASPGERDSARRRLEWLYVNATFYGPRNYAATESWREVLVLLDLGRLIRPLFPDACRTAADAMSHLGNADAARYPECRTPGPVSLQAPHPTTH